MYEDQEELEVEDYIKADGKLKNKKSSNHHDIVQPSILPNDV